MRKHAILILVLALCVSVALSVTAPTSFAQPDPLTIYPGVGIGPVRLGMNVQRDVVPLLGAWTSSKVFSDGTVLYRWGDQSRGYTAIFEHQGSATEMFVSNLPRYTVRGIHIGSGEARVRSVFGEPLRVTTESSTDLLTPPSYLPDKLLWYRGILFYIAQNDADAYYQKVMQINILSP